MEKNTLLLLLLLLLATAIASHQSAQGAPAIVYTAELRQSTAAAAAPALQSYCNGSIAECAAMQEFQMYSEVHRRLLQQAGQHLTSRAQYPDRPVCDVKPGQSYGGNCLPSPSNPPSRPCSAYNRCRGGSN